MQRVASLQSSNTGFMQVCIRHRGSVNTGMSTGNPGYTYLRKCQAISAQGNGGGVQEEMEKLRAACCE